MGNGKRKGKSAFSIPYSPFSIPGFKRRRASLYLDLWAANIDQLIEAGVDAGDVFLCGLSTVSHPEVFDSYRVEGERAGRMSAIIAVP